jgi:MoaA/NifB/PqqE/SkfB family radical SAM enzyme
MRQKYQRMVMKRIANGDYLWLMRNAIKYFQIMYGAYTGNVIVGPMNCSIALSWSCNARCIMCDYPKRADPKNDLTKEEIKRIIDDLVAIHTTGMTFFGGEPLLNKNIFELIRYANERGLVTHIPTNGILLSDRVITKKLIESGIDTIVVSIDSTTPKGYREVRRVNSFKKVVKGIKNVLELRKGLKHPPTVTMAVTISEKNIDEVPKLIKFARGLKVDTMQIFPAQPVETVKNEFNEKMNDKLKKIFKLLIKEKKTSNFIDDSMEYLNYAMDKLNGKDVKIKCFAPYIELHIDCFGNVYMCSSFMGLNQPIGNIRHSSVKDFWYSKKMKDYRKTLEKCQACDYMCHKELSLPFNKLWFKEK